MDSMPDDLRDRLTLHLVSGVGPRLMEALLERFGSAGRVLRASTSELMEVPRIGDKLATAIAGALADGIAETELEQIRKQQVDLYFLGTPSYPLSLVNIPDVPPVLYARTERISLSADADWLASKTRGVAALVCPGIETSGRPTWLASPNGIVV